MAVGAVLIARVQHVVGWRKGWDSCSASSEVTRAIVTLEAHREHNRPSQQSRVWRAVRIVAHLAALDTYRWVLECKRAALICVTFETGFLVGKHLADECRARRHSPGWREGSMWIVAVGASHEARIYLVFVGHRELRSYVRMAAVAQVRLSLRQKMSWGFGFVDGVAICANNVIEGMR
jgi:hypothetical protein